MSCTVFEIRCKTRDEAENEAKRIKKEYPNMVCKPTGYNSDIYVIELHENWHKFLTEKEFEGRKFNCVNCNDGLCETKKPSWNSSMSMLRNNERCFGEEFWADIYKEKNRHFVDKHNRVLAFTNGYGGFGNIRYNVKLEDGTEFEDVGLWHRGTLPKNLVGEIQKGELFLMND